MKAAGETEIGEGDSFSANGFLKVYALQPGQAKITVVDKNTSKKLIVSITVTADYNTEIFTDFCPNNATYVAGSAVACTFGVTPPSTGELKCRIILSEEPDMSGTAQTADITINGTEGEKKVYNEKGETTTFSNLKSDSKYYWRISYYDTRSGSYVNGSPINWFKTITLCPDENHPHIIDMGEAGKWACCNVGASAPWEYGGYYAWGETEEKSDYGEETYLYFDLDAFKDGTNYYDCFKNLGNDIAGTEYDVAHVKWGDNWCLPNLAQIEILNSCSSVWTSVNGVYGRKYTASNGSSIFLPAITYKSYNFGPSDCGFYWSSTQKDGSIYPINYSLVFGRGFSIEDHFACSSYWGQHVRPVISEVSVNGRFLIFSHQRYGVTCELYEKNFLNDTRVNGDGKVFYRSQLTLSIEKNGNKRSEVISNDLYLSGDEEQSLCMVLDLKLNNILFFINSKNEDNSYGMDGYLFESPLDNISLTKKQVFYSENWGWMPYFTCTDGIIDLQHYNFSDNSAMISSINSDGKWSTKPADVMEPLDFEARWKENGNFLVIFPEIDPAVTAGLCPDSNHPHVIDMGDAGKWSCCNVDASVPWEYGGCYAWGETEEKDVYDWITYKHCDGKVETCHDLGADIAGTDYDVAHVKWGDMWRLPNIAQMLTLCYGCTSEWTSVYGIDGQKFTAPNGGTIFLPAAGNRSGYDVNTGINGGYWSSSQLSNDSEKAEGLNISGGRVSDRFFYRYYGQCVRPVLSESEDPAVTAGLCPDSNHPHIIDMGEAGKWSCCNVGANAPWEYGGYYAWGETEEKDYYDWSTYIHCDGSWNTCHDLGRNISGTDYDVAHVKWGGSWMIPRNYHIQALLNNCSSEWTSVNGINGRKFTAPNNGTIFLPAAGDRAGDDTDGAGSYGFYWSSTQYPDGSDRAYNLGFSSGHAYWYYIYGRLCGQSIRPVISESESQDPAVAAGLCPDENHPHIIDMGEAGKWSCCNVGAFAPWEYGGYYAWGETEEKYNYSWETYIHCDGSYDTCHDLGEDIAGTECDVAHVKWGGNWCMPSRIQQDNLIQNCSSEWTKLNGVFGRKYISPDGGAIFLPAAGYTRYEESMSINEDGNYWSSTPYGYVTDKNSQAAFYLNFNNNKNEWHFTARVWGRSVRPVIDESEHLDPAVSAGLCPDENHPHIIDMGEAGKWSCCNVGASAPWEYGGYYAWGETEEKDNYSWETYIHYDGSSDICHDLGKDIAGTQYDVAHVKWGGKWRMPSHDQQMLLLDNCSSEWTSVNGIKGRKFIASNSCAIFMPAAGYHRDDYTFSGHGCYWASTQSSQFNSFYASYLAFGSGDTNWNNCYRNEGQSVRPVTE